MQQHKFDIENKKVFFAKTFAIASIEKLLQRKKKNPTLVTSDFKPNYILIFSIDLLEAYTII